MSSGSAPPTSDSFGKTCPFPSLVAPAPGSVPSPPLSFSQTLSPELCPKKLRCSDHDLTVVLKYTETDGKEGKKDELKTKEYQMYYQTLASMSKFVDAALTTDMKEKETKTISLDVTPQEFETALGYIENPIKVLTMTPQDALKVVPFYDQHEFTGGLAICDEVLKAYLTKQPIWDVHDSTSFSMDSSELDPDLLVDVIAAGFKYTLTLCLDKGIHYLDKSFRVVPARNMFTESHFRELQPLFQSGKIKTFPVLTSEEIESVLFPKYVFTLYRALSFPVPLSLNVIGGDQYCNGRCLRVTESQYTCRYRDIYYVEKNAKFGRDWLLTKGESERTILYRSPCSWNAKFPPTWPWVPVEGTTTTTISINYQS